VFPAAAGNDHHVGMPRVWRKLKAMAIFTDVWMHDLRHGFASIAVADGSSRLNGRVSKGLPYRHAGSDKCPDPPTTLAMNHRTPQVRLNLLRLTPSFDRRSTSF
jgi:hypothetical protein